MNPFDFFRLTLTVSCSPNRNGNGKGIFVLIGPNGRREGPHRHFDPATFFVPDETGKTVTKKVDLFRFRFCQTKKGLDSMDLETKVFRFSGPAQYVFLIVSLIRMVRTIPPHPTKTPVFNSVAL